MKTFIVATIAIGVSTSALAAEDIAPTAVSFTNGAVSTPLTSTPGDPVSGRDIVGSKGEGNCIACHQVTDLAEVPFQGDIGPMLDGTGSRWSPEELRGIVSNAKMTFEGTMMPSFYKTEGFIRPGDGYTGEAAVKLEPILSAQQIEDVVAYLTTLTE